MIPITFTKTEKEKLKKWYIDLIESQVISGNVEDYYRNVENELMGCGISMKMKDILVMDHEELNRLRNLLESSGQVYMQYSIPKNGRVAGHKYIADNDILKKTYNFYEKIPKYQFVKKIGITVCPYCNREFINNRDKKTSAQLDHFFPRSKYPVMAISLFNLIPSCYSCNHIKLESLLDVSPHENNLRSNSYYEFSYLLKGLDYMKNKEDIKIIIRPLNKNKNNVKVLHLEHAYEIHSDVVQEILKKKIVYSDGQIEEFLKGFKGLFSSSEEIRNILYGNYLQEKELGKRPLAKLMSDIIGDNKTK